MKRDIVLRENLVVEKIAFVEKLDHFIKTLSTKVFNGYKNSLGVRCVSNMF